MCITKAHNEKSSAQLLALSHSPRRGMRVAEKSNKSPTTTLDSKSTPVRKFLKMTPVGECLLLGCRSGMRSDMSVWPPGPAEARAVIIRHVRI